MRRELHGDAATELSLSLDAAGETLTGEDFVQCPGLPRRSKLSRPVRKPLASTRSDNLQSAVERSLRRLACRFAEDGRAPEDNPNLLRRIQLEVRRLGRRFPEISRFT